MAQFVGGVTGIDGSDPFRLSPLQSSTGFGTPSDTSFTMRAPAAFTPDNAPFGYEWSFVGTGFASYANGFPATGTITGLTFRQFGATVLTTTDVNLSVATLFNLLNTDQFEAIYELVLAGDDTITLSSSADSFNGRGGNDLMRGLGGADSISGGSGNDTLEGGDGNDYLDLGPASVAQGDDQLFGGAGDDVIGGGAGLNLLDGGHGDDIIVSSTSGDTVVGGSGYDLLAFSRENSNTGLNLRASDFLSATPTTLSDGTVVSGFERVSVGLGSGNDIFFLDRGLFLISTAMNGGSGSDLFKVDLTNFVTAPIYLALQASGNSHLGLRASTDFMILESFERLEVLSGSGADTLGGGFGNDLIDGGIGNDTINGGGGNDVLRGGADNDLVFDGDGEFNIPVGNDALEGGTGNDTVIGGGGTNTLSGGAGDDSLTSGLGSNQSGVAATDTIDGGDGIDTLSMSVQFASSNLTFDLAQMATSAGLVLSNGTTVRNIELVSRVVGGQGDDTFIADASSQFDGRGGNDRLVADFSAVTVNINSFGGGIQFGQVGLTAFVESAQITGGSGNDTFNGYLGTDLISGGLGNDTINGGNGNDTIDGGAGNDRLILSGALFNVRSTSVFNGGDGIDTFENNLASFGGAPTDFTYALGQAATDVGMVWINGARLRNIEAFSLDLGSGNETVSLGSANLGVFGQRLIGGQGTDTIIGDFSGATANITANGFDISSTTGGFAIREFEIFRYTGGSGADNLQGSFLTDTLNGGAGADLLVGGGGADLLFGGAGNDTLQGTVGTSIIDGGEGIDLAVFNFGSASSALVATSAVLQSNEGINFAGTLVRQIESFNFTATGFDDVFTLNTTIVGQNTFEGTAGNDTFIADFTTATGAVRMMGSSEFTFASSNFDRLNVYAERVSVTGSGFGDTLWGGNNIDEINGADGNDNIQGMGGADRIEGGAGADTIRGGSEIDLLIYTASDAAVTIDLRTLDNGLPADFAEQSASGGHAQGDMIYGFENVSGSNFDDLLIGANDANLLIGNGGGDTLVGGAGADTLDGGDGFDLAGYRTASAGVAAFFGGANIPVGDAAGDVYINIEGLEGSAFGDTLGGNDLANVFWGGDGNDLIFGNGGADILIGGNGADTLDGGFGFDIASYVLATEGLTLFMGGGTFNSGEAKGDVHTSIEGLIGSNFSDIIGGDAGINELRGLDGNDFIYGRAGVDTLIGDDGNDVLSGGLDRDRLDGGGGIDVAFYRDATSGLTASLLSGGGTGEAAGDTYLNIENIWGSDFNDVLTGDNGAGQVYGFAGNDQLSGLDGEDYFYGGQGFDTLTGGAGVDNFFFLSWNDHTNQYGTLEPYEGGDNFTDFQSGTDKIILSRYWFGFGNIDGPAAALTETHANFVTNGAVSTGRPSLIWSNSARTLSFDADGAGATQAVLLGTFQGSGQLTLSDIWTA
jgi:Ca2+-binding RTX toxin-like protein